MYKVTIILDGPDGRVMRIPEDTNTKAEPVEIAKISNYRYTDICRYPNTAKHFKLRLLNGQFADLTHGGFVDGKFAESCHMKCVWGRYCLDYGKTGSINCIHSQGFKNPGFYILDISD